MATVTLGGSIITTSVDPWTTGAFSPAVGDLIVVIAVASSATSWVGTTCTESAGGGTYSMVSSSIEGGGSSRECAMFIADQPCSATTSRTITITGVTGEAGGGCAAFQVTGMVRLGSFALRQESPITQVTAGSTPAAVFPRAPLTENPVFGTVGSTAASVPSVTQPASWTQDVDLNYTIPTAAHEICHRASGETGTTITWGSIIVGSTAGQCKVWELDTSSQPKQFAFTPVPYIQAINHGSPI